MPLYTAIPWSDIHDEPGLPAMTDFEYAWITNYNDLFAATETTSKHITMYPGIAEQTVMEKNPYAIKNAVRF